MHNTTDSAKPHNIALIGIKHSGKSLVAQRVSQIFHTFYIDADYEICQIAMRDGIDVQSARELFIQKGEEVFRKYEYSSVQELPSDKKYVYATGGGIADNKEALDLLAQRAVLIYLEADVDVLFTRIMKHGMPPFLNAQDPYSSFVALYTRRTAQYVQYADISISTEEESIEKTSAQIVASYQHYLEEQC